MSFLSSFLGSLGLSGDSGGSIMGSNLLNMFMSPINAGMDSLGLSQHGRDQYFARDLQRELLWDQINAQIAENKKNRDFSKEMFELNWQKTLQNYPELLKMSSDSQFNLWRNQFNSQNAYNNPTAQVSRMMSAGINPAANGAITQGANSMGASSVTPPPNIQGSPLGGSVSPVGLPPGLSSNGSQLRDIGSFLRDVAQANKQGVETDQLKKLFDYEVEERSQRIFGQRLVNDSISLANYVENNIKDVKVKKATQELLKLVAETKNVEQDTMLKLQDMFTKRSEELLNLAKSNLSSKEFEFLELKVKNFDEEFKTTMANIRSQTQKNVSEVRLNNALRETENVLRDGKVSLQELAINSQTISNELLKNDLWISNRTMDAKIDAMLAQFRREGIITKQEEEKLYQLRVSSDWAERREFIGYVGALCGAVGSILGGAGSALSGAGSFKNAQWNNLNYQEKNRITEQIGVEKNRILNEYIKDAKDAKRSSVLGPEWEMYSDQWSR